MKQNFYKITASNRFQTVIQFLRKELGWKAGDALVCIQFSGLISFLMVRVRQFTYINLAFSPSPDDTVSNLFKVPVLHSSLWTSATDALSSVICNGRAFDSQL